MSVIGGSIRSVSIGNDFRKYEVTADADGARKIGGFENEISAFGSGGARQVMTRVPMMIDSLVVGIDDDRGDQEFLQDFADTPGFQPIRITLASGISWQGTAQVSGELNFSTMQGTCTLSLAGPGRMTRQS